MHRKLHYLDHIDFLRAIAVLLVIFFHLDISLFSGGFIGVDVFFVISGYLITRNIKFEFNNTKKVNFKKFYLGRIRRLIPSLLLMIFLTFILSFLFYPPSLFSGFVKSMFFSSIALSNFYFLSEANYFDVASSLKPLLHTWSLGIEEQFYLIYPITFFIIIKLFSKVKHIVLVIMSLLLLSLILNIVTSSGGENWENLIGFFIKEDNFQPNIASLQFYLLPFRVFEFLMGGILVFIPKKDKSSQALKSVFNIVGLVLIIISGIIFSSDTKLMSILNIVPCLGASLFISNPPDKLISSIYNLSFFKLTGKISYTLYLFHWPVIVFYKFISGHTTNFIENGVLIIIMFLFSYVVYTYYENPLRNRHSETRVISNRYLIGSVLGSIILITIIKIDVIKKDGWLWRLSDETIEFAQQLENPFRYNEKNWGAAGYKSYGYIGDYHTSPPSMIWMGDSHAGHYCFGLDSIMVKKNKKSIFMSYDLSALNLPDIIHKKIDSSKTKKHLGKLLKLINENPKSSVVISHFWDGHMRASKIKNDKTGKYENFTQDSIGFRLVCEKIVKFSKLIGKRDLFVIGENPFKNETDLSYIDNVLVPKYFNKGTSVSSYYEPPKVVFEINSFFNEYFNNVENINFIDPAAVFCKENLCLEHKSSNVYFSDKNHLSKVGSLRVIASVEEKLMDIVKNINSNQIINTKFLDRQEKGKTEYIEPNKIIDHKSSLLNFKGWYPAEANHIWGSGNSSDINFELENKDNFKGVLELEFGIFKQQEIQILINGKIIDSKILSGWNNSLTFTFDPSILVTGDNTLTFKYSDPKPVNTEKDQRILALALRSIRLN